MKKFFASVILGAVILFGSQFVAIPTVAAQDVYIKTYSDSSGTTEEYVATESIDTNGVDYVNVTVKLVKNGKLVAVNHLNYTYVGYRNGVWQGYWEMSSAEGRSRGAKSIKYQKPTEDETLWYCLNYR